MGSGCGAVGRAVTSDTIDLRLESSHEQFYLLFTVLKAVSKRRKYKREAGFSPYLKKIK